jgi:hypothetical protein
MPILLDASNDCGLAGSFFTINLTNRTDIHMRLGAHPCLLTAACADADPLISSTAT